MTMAVHSRTFIYAQEKCRPSLAVPLCM